VVRAACSLALPLSLWRQQSARYANPVGTGIPSDLVDCRLARLESNRKTAHFIEKRITAMPDEKLDGAIILIHVGYPETVAAVPRVIAALRQRHFEFVTILQWIADTPNSEQHDRPRFAR
jgi:peptidoglycan/xylan/chitin deacetylase (PgdA/CDA1 family)